MFDSLMVACIANEISETLVGGVVDKVTQVSTYDFMLHIFSAGKKYKLIASADPILARIHLAEEAWPKVEPTHFCNLLGSQLQSAVLTSSIQPRDERIMILCFKQNSALTVPTERKLVVELLGKNSNLFLLDQDNYIIDAARRNTGASSNRELSPGTIYSLPNKGEKLPLSRLNRDETATALERVAQQEPLKPLYKLIIQAVAGIGDVTAKELAFRAGIPPNLTGKELSKENIEKLVQEILKLSEAASKADFQPTMAMDETKKPLNFCAIDLTSAKPEHKRHFDSPSRLLERFFKTAFALVQFERSKQYLDRELRKLIKKQSTKLKVQEQEAQDAKTADRLRLYGELLLVHSSKVKKGMTSVSLPNIYSPQLEEVQVPLRPDLGPVENAQQFFKQYKKLIRRTGVIQEEINRTKSVLEYLEQSLFSLSLAQTTEDVNQIALELSQQGHIKGHNDERYHRPKLSSAACNLKPHRQPLRFTSSEGIEIIVGRNSYENEEITRQAKPHDVWLHARQIPGSHVILKVGSLSKLNSLEHVPQVSLNEAASIAAYFSKAKDSLKVPVDYTFRKHVRKPPGAPPGMVTYENHKTVIVQPFLDEGKMTHPEEQKIRYSNE